MKNEHDPEPHESPPTSGPDPGVAADAGAPRPDPHARRPSRSKDAREMGKAANEHQNEPNEPSPQDTLCREVAAELAPVLKRLAARRHADAVEERTRIGEGVLKIHRGSRESVASQKPTKESSFSKLEVALRDEGFGFYNAKKLWNSTRAHLLALELRDRGFPAPEELSTDHLLTLNTVREKDLRLRLAGDARRIKSKAFREHVRSEKVRSKQRKREEQYAEGDPNDTTTPSAADTYTSTLVRRAARRGATAVKEVLPDSTEHPKPAILLILSEIYRELFGEANQAVIFQADSRDPKLTDCILEENPDGKDRSIPMGFGVCTTYGPIAVTCDASACPIYGECYPVSGPLKKLMRKLDAAAAGMTADEVAELEAFIIDQQWPDGVPQDGARGGRDLRLHVSGDVLTEKGARLLGAAATRWRRRGGGRVWLYTHSWRGFLAEAFGPDITALASVETEQEAEEAIERGYIAFLLLPRTDDDGFENGKKPFDLPEIGRVAIPCKAQTMGSNCAECRLCLGEADLTTVKGKPGMVIAVLAHGRDKHRVVERVKAKAQAAARVRLTVVR